MTTVMNSQGTTNRTMIHCHVEASAFNPAAHADTRAPTATPRQATRETRFSGSSLASKRGTHSAPRAAHHDSVAVAAHVTGPSAPGVRHSNRGFYFALSHSKVTSSVNL